MEKALYFECATGISGDMTVAALLDLGADRDALRRMLDSLPLDGVTTAIRRVSKAGLDMCDFDVILPTDNHDHDMEYLYGHEHHHHQEHDHEHDHEHEHEHEHEHHHDHEHRGLPEILDILRQADMTPRARELAEKTFRILADAEAKAHGVTPKKVHFHEVGAADSIVDVAAAAVCLDSLGVRDCVFPALCEGTGSVRCQHGVLPVPVPAVLNIAQAHGLPLTVTSQRGELVTPTGAALAAAFRTSGQLPERFRVLKIGMGAGKREYERPSVLRVMLIEPEAVPERPARTQAVPGNPVEAQAAPENLVLLETNVDDCTGEALGFTLEQLLQAGARDAFYTPVYMKKNRPGWLLSVLCDESRRAALERVIFANTSTIGIRRTAAERTTLPRRSETVKTSLGEVAVKRYAAPDGERVSLEYESVAAICRATGKSWQAVTETLRAEI